ncbi:hypothetical protein BGZ99_008003 [Dissophora globulifera]|uniref:Uncharacterized protein n=1 Tax=Dissophora globulifera TaxID=979702 RepID=A0A9P6V0W6_9FUNG|nr:hypothetical protein BGZ99_008003 [Dissophora globulifera]
MTLEQVQQHVHRKQQSLLEEQVQQEQQQRMRQQRELQLELAKHRNAILARQTKEDEQQQKQHQQTAQRRDQDVNRVDNAAAETVKATAATTVESSANVEVQDREPSRPFVATRHRSVFGYRGPEQSGQNAVEPELQEPVATITMESRRVLFMITAENRVRLALLDYTPKQIDAMTPAQALAILSPGSQKQQEARLDCQETTPELSQDEQQQQQRNRDTDDHGLEMDIISTAQDTGGSASMLVVADVISSPDSHGHNYSHGHGGLVSSPSSTSPTPKAASSRRSTDNSSSSSSSSPSTF